MKTEIYAKREPWGRAISVHFGQHRAGGEFYSAKPMEFVKVDIGEISAPTLSLQIEDAQRLIDELWSAGLRPSEGTGSAGSLAATERHLKDMQAIAMGLLRKDGMQT